MVIEDIFKCRLCIYTTTRQSNMKRHHSAKHKGCATYELNNTDILKKEVLSPKKHILHGTKHIHENTNQILSEETQSSATDLQSCLKCNKQYKTASSLRKHEATCKGIDILTCPRCMKSFSSTSNKSKHIKLNTCKPRSVLHSKTFQNQSLSNNNNNNTNINNQTNIQNQNNTNIQNQNNIYINNYGSERLDHITDEEIRKILTSGENTLPLYIEKKHFDKNFPENRNIIVTRDNRCLLKEKDDWTERNINLLSSKLINENSKKLLLFYDNNVIEIGDHIRDDEIMIRVKDKLVSLYTKSDIAKYNKVLSLIKEVINKCKT